MRYSIFVDLYERLGSTSKRLEKIEILKIFLIELAKQNKFEFIYLLKGKVLADYDSREFGISTQLTLKAISLSFGVPIDEINLKQREIGDLGEVARFYSNKKRQSLLFTKPLETRKVIENLTRLFSMEGKGAVEKKLDLIVELLSYATPLESVYIIRTLLNDLRIGIADAIILEAIGAAFLERVDDYKSKLEEAYDTCNDLEVVFKSAIKGESGLISIPLVVGRPVKAMLAVKVESMEEGFEMCGKPLALEYKYDGFRMMIHKKEDKVWLFTRKLEEVTNQFPDVVATVKKNIKGESFILDSEVVGYDPKTKKYTPFEAISQRIKRKYSIEELSSKLPVEINIFDVLYYDGESYISKKLFERRKILDRIVKPIEHKIKVAEQLVTSDIKKAEEFYKEALAVGEEGVMLKNLESPYKQGRKVGYMAKLKPVISDLDLVIVGADYGTGKRGGLLTSYVLACKDGDRYLELGRVSSGLKEKEEEGTTYEEITNLLKPLITEEIGQEVRVKPLVVVSVTYQNIQESPSYSSGYALRFPRITRYRPDKQLSEIASLEEISKEAKKADKKAL